MAVVAALSGVAWGQAAPSGSHEAAKATDTGFASQVNSTGGFASAVPLDLPSAKRGLPVPVSVVYGGRAVGAAGMGWDIPLTYIVRDTTFAHRLPWYDDTVTNFTRGTFVPRGVEQLVLVMDGKPIRLMRKGDQQSSTTWVPVGDAPQLEVHEDVAHGAMLMYDGDGRTYTFLNTGPVGPPGQPPTGHVLLLDGQLYMLTSIATPGNKVLLEYLNVLYSLPGNSTGLEINLHSVSYNSPTATSTCAQNRIVLTYNAPTVAANNVVALSMTMVGNGILMRTSTLKWIDVHGFNQCIGPTDQILRRHTFTYDTDPDTNIPRLTSVVMSGRQGTPEAQKTISLGQFGYGTASIPNGAGRKLRYDLKQTLSLPTGGRALGESTSSLTDRGTWSQLVDVTGDGRPDLVHQVANGNTFVVEANFASSGGGTAFAVTNDVPPSVMAAPDKPLEREWITNTPSDLDVAMPGRVGRDQNVWRQLIDVNGDGRVDLIDAREVMGQWVVYLNTPGPTPWEIRWRRTAIDVAKLKQVLQGHNYVIDDFLPLSRRHTGMEGVTTATFTCTGSSACPGGSDRWVLSANGIPSPTVVVQSTYVEWELRDVNGDGYMDVVFNDVGGVNENELLVRPVVSGQPGTTAPGEQKHMVELPATGIDVVYNLAGPLLSGGETGISLYPFAAPVQVWSADHMVTVSDRSTDLPPQWITLSSPRRCGVGLWVQGQPTGLITPDTRPAFIDLSTQYCGFADVNGDGLVDRIEKTTAYLQGGNANFGVTQVPLQSYMHGSSNDSRVLCCNDRNSTCEGVTQAINFNANQEFALKDINGDGIPDYVDQHINRQTLQFTQQVYLGTGTSLGFGPPLTLQTGNPLKPILLSYESPGCPGFFEIADAATLIGLYDLDGDGKAEMVDSDGNVYALNDGSQADWGRPGAGRLTSIDNGHGALTKVTYRSAKEDLRTSHQVSFPEIVATRIEMVKSSDGTSPLAAEVDYAFGSPTMVLDSLTKQWQFLGYRHQVVMQRDGSANGRMTVTDAHEFLPADGDPAWTPLLRFLVNRRAGLPKDVTVMVGAMSDAWAEVGIGVDDPRTIGSTHYDYDARMVTEPDNSTVAFCREMADPYDYPNSQAKTTTWPVCVTHGIASVSSISTWRGTAAPPSTASVRTLTQVSHDIYGRVTEQTYFGDGELPLVINVSYATPTAAAGSNAPRVLNAVTTRTVSAIPLLLDAEETWQYDGDAPNTPSGTVSAGFPTTHTVLRIRNDFFGQVLGKTRTSFLWDTAGGVLTSMSAAREDASGHADGASRTVTLSNYDDFKLLPRQTQVDAVGVAGAPTIPSLITTVQPDPFTMAVQISVDENSGLAGACRDGFGRVYETFVGTNSGALKFTSTTSYTGFASGETGPRQIATKTFVDLAAPQDPCNSPPPPLSASGINATVYLDELGRPSYTATQLGTNYGNQTLITDQQIYDLWGRTVYAPDPYVGPQNIAATFGTSSYFQVDGVPDCIIRGPAGATGPHDLTRVTDESHEVYPTCFRRTFESNLERLDTQEPDSLVQHTAQSGVIHSVIKSVTGRVLSRSSLLNNVRLEYAEFGYNDLGRLGQMRRYADPVNAMTPSIVTWTWDSLGQTLELDDAAPAAPRLRSYSSWGELTEESWNDSNTSPPTTHRASFRYDALGRMLHSEESQQSGTTLPEVDLNTVNDYVYDTGTPFAGGTVDFTPTHLTGRLARAVSPAQTVSLSYDELGRLNGQAFTDGQLYVETRSYHSDGTLDKLHLFLPDHLDSAGHSVDEYASYSYDSMRRINEVSYADGSTTEALFSGTRDVLGRITQGQYDATTETATYAANGRRLLTSWKLANSNQSHSRQITIQSQNGSGRPAYDALGRQNGRLQSVDGFTSAPGSGFYTYDALGRLQQLSGNGFIRSFFYDALGNVLQVLRDDQAQRPAEVALTYSTTDPDRIERITYGDRASGPLGYDAMGNITQMSTASGGFRNIFYLENGAVSDIIDNLGNAAHYKYDAFGNVAQLEIDSLNPGDSRHDRHYGATIAARDEIVGGTVRSVVIRNIPGDRGILATRHGPTSTWTFGFGEEKGNRFFTDGSANFIQDENYAAFGAPMSSPPAEKRVATYSSDKWNGGDTLEVLGLTMIGVRLYDPVIGRFLSRDPLIVPRTAATTNPYAFAANDPVNVSDPSGLDWGTDPSAGGFCTGPEMCGQGSTVTDPLNGGTFSAVYQGSYVDQMLQWQHDVFQSVLARQAANARWEAAHGGFFRGIADFAVHELLPRAVGGVRLIGAALAVGVAVGVCQASLGFGCAFSVVLAGAAADVGRSAAEQLITGESSPTFLGHVGGPTLQQWEEGAVDAAGLAGGLRDIAAKRAAKAAAKAAEGGSAGFTDPANRKIAEYLEGLGRKVSKNPLEGVAGAGRQGDAIVDGLKVEFKTLDPGATSATVRNAVTDSLKRGGQAREILIDVRESGLSLEEAQRGAARALGLPSAKRGLDGLTILGDGYFFRWTPR